MAVFVITWYRETNGGRQGELALFELQSHFLQKHRGLSIQNHSLTLCIAIEGKPMTETDITDHSNPGRLLVTFDNPQKQLHWEALGDRVMGGQSDGTVDHVEGGVGVFHGTVRLDNGGGFASVKADLPEPVDATGFTGIELLALGDGKTYKIGLRNTTERRSIVYQHAFTPDTEDWSRIRLPFNDFVPTWRGKTVEDAGPLETGNLASVSLFVSGRQAGEFQLIMQNWRLFRSQAG